MIDFMQKLTDGLNEQQKSAVLNPCDSCTKIVAGAGTGKTKIISKRFTKLVSELKDKGTQDAQNRILVITFTDKASGEMKSRILNELKENGIKCDAPDLWISTFHSFCSRILKKHSIEAGFSPSFKLADENTLQNIYDNILKRIKYGESDSITDIDELTKSLGIESDILSVESVAKLAFVHDVETLLDSFFDIIKKIKSLGYTPKEFYDKTVTAVKNFTKKTEKIPFKFSSKEEYALAWALNYREYIDDSCTFDTDLFDSIAKEKVILDKFGKRKAEEYGQAQGFPENLPEITDIELHLTKVIAVIYAVYQNELERADLADFDDLINKTIEILKTNSMLREYYQSYFKHIIIDEFQDTNGAQLELIEHLLDSNNANITFVGDRKQSIYGFRHAVMENLEVLHNDVERKYGQKFKPINLSLNYRSTPEVLNAVNCVTENELQLPEEKLTAGIEYPKSDLNVIVTPLDGFDNSYEHKIAEAKYISDEILRLKERDKAAYKDFSILVKSHSQADLMEKYLRKKGIPALKKVNTGYFKESVIKNVIALLRLVKNTTDEIAFIRIMRIKFSDAQIYRLKESVDSALLQEIEFDELKKLTFSEKYMRIREKLDVSDISDFCRLLLNTVFEIRKSSETLLQSYYKLVNTIKPYSYMSEFELYKAQNELIIFERIMADFMQKGDYISIGTFLDYIEKASEDKSFELPSVAAQGPDAVQILTIHASKGLEFPYVFMASVTSVAKSPDKGLLSFDMQYGDKPGFGLILNKYKDRTSPKSLIYKEIWKKPRDKNEALRLFYVAVSRAKKYLNVLSFVPYGNNSSIKPASYIQNLGDYLDSNKPIFN